MFAFTAQSGEEFPSRLFISRKLRPGDIIKNVSGITYELRSDFSGSFFVIGLPQNIANTDFRFEVTVMFIVCTYYFVYSKKWIVQS